MAITGTQISGRAGILLQDTSGTRWDPTTERLAWINDGRREMAILKPAVFGAAANEITHTLTTGCKQRIATTDAYKIASVDYNVTSGVAIRPTTQDQLDAFKPAWRGDTGDDVQNWFSDQTDPLSFWVYPASTGNIKAHVHISPPDLASLDDVALPFDIYEPVLVNYVCYRALSKEDEAGAVAKAQAFYALFTSALA
jgi:hypothetical protein